MSPDLARTVKKTEYKQLFLQKDFSIRFPRITERVYFINENLALGFLNSILNLDKNHFILF